jgi:hypothetical protein
MQLIGSLVGHLINTDEISKLSSIVVSLTIAWITVIFAVTFVWFPEYLNYVVIAIVVSIFLYRRNHIAIDRFIYLSFHWMIGKLGSTVLKWIPVGPFMKNFGLDGVAEYLQRSIESATVPHVALGKGGRYQFVRGPGYHFMIDQKIDTDINLNKWKILLHFEDPERNPALNILTYPLQNLPSPGSLGGEYATLVPNKNSGAVIHFFPKSVPILATTIREALSVSNEII